MDWLLSPEGLAVVRRAYARQMLGIGNIRNDRLELAFATIRREHFLGPEPWQIVQWPPGPLLPANDPVYVYQDVVLALAPERGLNTGSTSLHAKMLNDLAVEPGQHVAHIGAGAGYYTAMLAELTGPSGRVTAIEFNAALADRARANLAEWDNVTVMNGDGGNALAENADRIYVNFSVAAPAPAWIERLNPYAKLLFVLGAAQPNAREKFPRHAARGGAFLIERTGNRLAARWLYPAYFVCGEGMLAGSADAELALFEAFERGGFEFVQSLRWNERTDPARRWYGTASWSLAYDGVDGPA
jgi:protein-L-isoaspartate(D-aspartate) O-methyltransferase